MVLQMSVGTACAPTHCPPPCPCTHSVPQPGRTPHEKLQGATAVLRNGLKQAFTPEEYEWAKMQARTAGPAATASPVQAAPGAPQQHAALQQQQAAAAQMQQRQVGVPAGMQQQQAAQQQAQQRAGAQSAARGPSPMPRNPSPAPAAAASAGVGGQPMLTAQQVIQAQQQQQQMIMQQAYAAQAAAAAAAAAHAAKRPAGGCRCNTGTVLECGLSISIDWASTRLPACLLAPRMLACSNQTPVQLAAHRWRWRAGCQACQGGGSSRRGQEERYG